MSPDLFVPGRNCWRVERATHASMLIDCENYYRALHGALCKARKSIFILGWDIDSRIRLLRGEDEARATEPCNLFDLLHKKAEENPSLQIYLNKWNYSLLMFGQERELFAGVKWAAKAKPNIHYCVDDILPMGACHHQKVVVVDDEVAFSGGMDVALGRWDGREHYPENEERTDPGILLHSHESTPYGPYHDIQMVVAGPAAKALAQLVRERWKLVSDDTPPPLLPGDPPKLSCWPDSAVPDFENVDIAIARTVPPLRQIEAVQEIRPLLLDEISRAENFIYIENQFLTCSEVARAISYRLQQKPSLRVLALSCYNPTGLMERKALWTGRVHFRDLVEQGGVADRVALCYPISRVNGQEKPVRIHSKIMIIDDRYLHLGSANLNNRSMGVDTECDLVIEGRTASVSRKIAAIRTDLIREHTGREAQDIEDMIKSGVSLATLLSDVPASRQHLRRIDDERYRHERFQSFARKIADSDQPLKVELKPLAQIACGAIIIAMVLGGLVWAWQSGPLAEYTSPERIETLLKSTSSSVWAVPLVLGVFVLAGLVFFPVTALIAATAAVFGAWIGFLLTLAGVAISATAGFFIGRMLGQTRLSAFLKPAVDKISPGLESSGVLAVTIIRMLPVAPFALVNMAFGLTHVSYPVYLAGTVLGLLPGSIVIAWLGGSLADLWRHPNAQDLGYVGLGVAAWIGLIVATHFLSRYLKAHKSHGRMDPGHAVS